MCLGNVLWTPVRAQCACVHCCLSDDWRPETCESSPLSAALAVGVSRVAQFNEVQPIFRVLNTLRQMCLYVCVCVCVYLCQRVVSK